MDVADFLRLYPLRCPNVHWLLGAGASAAAGIKTAYDVIWDLKRSIYCAAQRIPLAACSNLADPSLRARIQRYFDGLGTYPVEDAEDEYAFYFEATYGSEQDRRRYIDRLVAGGSPSYGHLALAALLATDKIRVVWTTNFDRMVEDAAIPALKSSGRLVVASLDAPYRALEAINEGRWPILGKIHGDFQSRRLKNTTEELRAQDEELRHALIQGCTRSGLAVVGYSGRDHSVMDALEAALTERNPYPSGLFWFVRSGSSVLPRVAALIEKARAQGVDAHLVEGPPFDELLGDIVRLMPDLPSEVTEQFNLRAQRVTEAPLPPPGASWPIIRTNGLLIKEAPTVCRRLHCAIGGTKEVRQAVVDAAADVEAGRTQFGVLAFGSDSEVRRAFDPFGIVEFAIHAINPERLRYETTELGLLYATLCRAIARERPLLVERRGRTYIARVDPARQTAPEFKGLRNATGALSGTVSRTTVRWTEAVRLRLEYRWDRLWLLLEPTIWTSPAPDEDAEEASREFVRDRQAQRYNQKWNTVLEGWILALIGLDADQEPLGEVALRAFGIANGLDAQFTITRGTGFSRRTNGRTA
jgi:hypothetical protein